ncbi:hypothetical protein ETB97_009428 [Aspergillus alliaceus]|uniref:PNPLA domain-containing protein n=1 Tax=Petromyces alliaceus TaxID=209559 RepID=A0A8H5ZUD6_PETAA|nr:hypothetical protein ETB97_009428 [Aspergillus burnettii]
MATGAPSTLDKSGLCLLSLDGGGVRGLSTLYILKHLMNRLSQERPDRGPVKPCEVFDLIGGTSTGGLIAIMLGRLEMSVDDCIETYVKLIRTIFEKKSRWPVNLSGNIKSRFDATKLEKAIKEVVASQGAKETDNFNDGAERGCRVFVCTTSYETKDIVRLRDYSVPTKVDIPATICQAALATSAATTFFNPVYIGTRKFVDGALGSNNPVEEVEGEAADIWCSGTGDLKPLVKCFVSIGTGNPGITAIEDKALRFLSETLVDIATETDRTEKKSIARWAKHFDEKRYFRFNVDQGLQEVGLEEYREQGKIEAATYRYLDHQAQAFQVRDCVQNLKLKESMAMCNISRILNRHHVPRAVQPHILPESKAPWLVPFQRNPLFVSRSSEIAKVDDMLDGEDRCERVAIVGLGGVGKTQIALEYVHNFRERYPSSAIFWIPVTNFESMLEAYLDIGKQLQIPNIEKEKSDIPSLVQQRLSQERVGKWLLVFDNADDISLWTDKIDNVVGSRGQAKYLPKSKLSHLLQAMNKGTLEEWTTKTLNRLNELFPWPGNENRILWRPLLPHARYLLDSLAWNIPTGAAVYLLSVVGRCSLRDGRYKEAEKALKTVADNNKIMFGNESFITLGNIGALAHAHLNQGQWSKAEELTVQVLESQKKLLGVEHQCTLNSMFTLITIYLEQERWAQAEKLELQAMEGYQKVLGEEHPETLTCKGSLASIYYNKGKWNQARRLRVQIMKGHRKTLGVEHPITLTSTNNLAHLYMLIGLLRKAERLQVQTTEIAEKVLGAEHPDTLDFKSVLAAIYCQRGRLKDAEKLQIQILKSYQEVLGPEHPDVAYGMGQLAYTWRKMGRYAEATELLDKCIQLQSKVLVANHSETLRHGRKLRRWQIYQQVMGGRRGDQHA